MTRQRDENEEPMDAPDPKPSYEDLRQGSAAMASLLLEARLRIRVLEDLLRAHGVEPPAS